jgi:hypothetical protein
MSLLKYLASKNSSPPCLNESEKPPTKKQKLVDVSVEQIAVEQTFDEMLNIHAK